MADMAICEKCGKTAPRRMMHVSPEGWWFGCFTFDEEGEHDPGDFLVVHACSDECRDALWTKMDGHRWQDIENRVDAASEIHRASKLYASRLRNEIARIRSGATENSAGARFAAILEQAADLIERGECDG